MMTRAMTLGRQEFGFLKEMLHAQQELLQKLYNELEMERESSAVAADEALSMILRLQSERAAMEMEASQYKRIAEEKMCHAQEMVEVFQELIYQKEMQISSLEFQVQAYKFKLASMGCEDTAACEMQYPENMLSTRNGSVAEAGGQRTYKRGHSLPLLRNDAMSRRSSSEGPRTATSSPNFNSYLEAITKLNERVQGFACFNDSTSPEDVLESFGSCSRDPPLSTSSMFDPSPDTSPAKPYVHNYSEKVLSVEACGDSQCSTRIQDIFEVPQCSNDDQCGTPKKNMKPKLSLEKVTRNTNLDSAFQETWKSGVKEKIDCEKQPLQSQGSNKSSPNPKDGKTERQILFKQLEGHRFVTRGREIDFSMRDEKLRLLREISDKVDSMQAEISNWRPKKPPEDLSCGFLKEAMLCFLP